MTINRIPTDMIIDRVSGQKLSEQLADNAQQLKNISVDVTDKQFGAKFDGTTNDSSAIQAAIDYVSGLGGGIVRLPRGTTKANITIKRAVSLIGAGKGATVIKPFTTGAVITYGDGSSLMATLTLQDFTIHGNTSDLTNDGIYFPKGTGTAVALSGFWECTFRDIFIQYCGRYGMNFSAGNNYQTQQFSSFENIHIRYCKNSGIYAVGNVQNNLFTRVVCRENNNHGMYLDDMVDGADHFSPNDNTFLRCVFENNENGGTCHGVYSQGQRNTFEGCWFERNGTQDTTAKLSTGFYNTYPATTSTLNRLLNCTFRNNFWDMWFFKGHNNIINGCSIMNDATTVAGKTFSMRFDSLSQNNIIGRLEFSLNGGAVAMTWVSPNNFSMTRNQPTGATTVTAGATSVVVPISEFNTPHIMVVPTWNTTCWVSAGSNSSFTVNFGTAPSVNSSINWRLG